MKTILNVKKQLFLFLLAFLAFACQDETINELSKNNPATEESEDARFGYSHGKVYVLVQGAWHPESAWKDVKRLLELCGHTVKTLELPGLGKDLTPIESVTFSSHVAAVQHLVSQQSRPVILLGHGYGGAVVSQVGENVPDKIMKVVYLSGIMPMDGQTVADLALSDTESLVTQLLQVDGAGAIMTDENYGKAVFNEALKRDPVTAWKARNMISQFRPHALATLFEPLHLTSNYDQLSKVYISCLKDKAVTTAAQQGMYGKFPGTKVYFLRRADHGAAITTPVELAEILKGL